MAARGGGACSGLRGGGALQHTSFFLDARSIVAVARSCRAAHRLCGSEELLKWVGSVRHHALPGMHCAEQLRLAEALDSVASTLEFEWGSTACRTTPESLVWFAAPAAVPRVPGSPATASSPPLPLAPPPHPRR